MLCPLAQTMFCRYQQKLQENLMLLAAVADAYSPAAMAAAAATGQVGVRRTAVTHKLGQHSTLRYQASHPHMLHSSH